MSMRRRFLALVGALVGFAAVPAAQSDKRLKLLIKSAWGSDDPTLVEWADHTITE